MMKKLLLFLTLLMTSLSSFAGSYFTMGVNDTLYIDPANSGNLCFFPVKAHFEYRFDSWTVSMVLPNDLYQEHVHGHRDLGMDVPYVEYDGSNDICAAVLTDNDTTRVYSSTITQYGYWDNDSDGIYECYGTVKWEPGDYNSMFYIGLNIFSPFRSGTIVLSGEMIGTYDARGGTSHETFQKSIFVKVGYRLGDVNGDGTIDISDASKLNASLLGTIVLNEFQRDAADIDHDGDVDIDDYTALVSYLLNGHF